MSASVRSRLVALISLSVWLALSAGCSSDSRPERPDGPPAAIPDFPPIMAGTENFADGKLSVRVTLAMPTAFRPGKEGERRIGGPRSGHRGGGPRGGGMGAGGPPGGMGGGEEPSDQGPGDDSPRRPALGSTLPAAQLKLHLQNTSSTAAISCEVVDFNSALGNFAVFPSRFQIEPGQSASSETMTSRLGVEGAEIPVTVALRVNDHVEKKVITLRLIPPESDKSVPSPAK